VARCMCLCTAFSTCAAIYLAARFDTPHSAPIHPGRDMSSTPGFRLQIQIRDRVLLRRLCTFTSWIYLDVTIRVPWQPRSRPPEHPSKPYVLIPLAVRTTQRGRTLTSRPRSTRRTGVLIRRQPPGSRATMLLPRRTSPFVFCFADILPWVPSSPRVHRPTLA
jgi:hypothetical protein